jgi:hypothetical protein
MKKHILVVVGYIIATIATQVGSHFFVFSSHYAEVSYIRPEPIFTLGIASMIIQGATLSIVYANSRFYQTTLLDAVKFAWLFGAFLVSYIGLGQAGENTVPNVATWVGVEALVGFLQFTLAGGLLRLVHKGR